MTRLLRTATPKSAMKPTPAEIENGSPRSASEKTPCPYRKVRLSFFSYTYRHPVLTVNLPLYTITLRYVRILIWKTVIGRLRIEVVENTNESGFREAQLRERHQGSLHQGWALRYYLAPSPCL